jgi:hypothetical protein
MSKARMKTASCNIWVYGAGGLELGKLYAVEGEDLF